MTTNHSVSDFASRLRNAYKSKRETIELPASRIISEIASVLKNEGYILNFSLLGDEEKGYKTIKVNLKYSSEIPAISSIGVISKPGKRVYCQVDSIPNIADGLGIVIISTSKGIMCDSKARELKVGGELLLKIF